MKKILGLLLVITLIVGTVSGCTPASKEVYKDDSSKDVTLKWVIPVAQQTDYSKVQDEINKLLPTLLPNTKLKLVLDASMGDKWALWMSGKTSFDLAVSGYPNDLQAEIMKNSYLPLNDLINTYAPTIKAEMEGLYHGSYMTGTYNDKLYAVPSIQYHIKETKLLQFSAKLEKYFDTDRIVKAAYSSPKTTEDIYKAIDEGIAKADLSKKAGEAKVNIDIPRVYREVAKRGYIFVGGAGSNICYDPYASKVKLIDFYTTEEFKTFIRYANKWYKSGNIPKDILTGEFGDTSGGWINAVDGGRIDLNARSFKISNLGSDDALSISLNKPEDDILGAHNIGSLPPYISIPFTAKNPVRAIQLMELLRTKKGAPLLNLIAYGIKDVHYSQVSDTVIHPFDYTGQATSNSKYGIPNWLVGSMFNEYIVNPPYTAVTMDYGKKYFENYLPKVKKSELYGFNFDLQSVKSAISQILSVNLEYESQLAYGVLENYQPAYDTLMSRNKTAGIENVISKFQKQADDYIKSK